MTQSPLGNVAAARENVGLIGLNASYSAEALLDSRHDKILHTLITWGWANQSDGDVQAPTGYFALMEVPDGDSQWQSVVEECRVSLRLDTSDRDTVPAPGWYILQETDQGIKYTFETRNQLHAEFLDKALVEEYGTWAYEGDGAP